MEIREKFQVFGNNPKTFKPRSDDNAGDGIRVKNEDFEKTPASLRSPASTRARSSFNVGNLKNLGNLKKPDDKPKDSSSSSLKTTQSVARRHSTTKSSSGQLSTGFRSFWKSFHKRSEITFSISL